MKHKIEFEIDGSALFDAVAKFGQAMTGNRLLETFLQASTGELTMRDHIGLALYGISAGEVQKVEDEPISPADVLKGSFVEDALGRDV